MSNADAKLSAPMAALRSALRNPDGYVDAKHAVVNRLAQRGLVNSTTGCLTARGRQVASELDRNQVGA